MAPPRARLAPAVPAELTSFVGRRHDLAAVRQLFSSARLVTLTGIGGVGKTRLALQAASEMRRAFPDGTYLIKLDALTDPGLLAQTVRDAMGLREQPSGEPLVVLEEFVSSRSLLLILDNCEHLVEAVADLADGLLRAGPELKVLTTSRQALRILGEHIYPVAPLLTPDPHDTQAVGRALKYPAVTLFADRAAAVVPGFTVTPDNEHDVVRLCHRLEGIPLAIELASVRLRALTVAELASRLDDRFEMLREGSRNLPERHQTLRALIDWSYDLCTPIEQLLWARSSTFSGGFTVAALEAVCSDDQLPANAMIDTVARLVDKSILVREERDGQTRFHMLGTIREYGRGRLGASPDASTIPRRHRDWCACMIASASAEWAGPLQAEWAQRLRLEHVNIRQALEYCMSTPGESRIGLEMAAVPWFWGAMDHLTEAQRWLQRGLALEGDGDSLAAAWACATSAYIAGFQGETEVMHTYADRAHDIAVRLDDRAALAFSHHVRAFGRSLGRGADLSQAIELFDEALAQYVASDVPRQYTDSLLVELAVTLVMKGDFDRARTVADGLYEQCTASGEQWNLSYALWLRGLLALIECDSVRAEADLLQALRMKRAFHDTLGIGLTLEIVAWVAAEDGDGERAALLFGATDQIWRTLGTRQLRGLRRRFEGVARRALGEERFEATFDKGRRLDVDTLLAIALREPLPDGNQFTDKPATTVPDGLTSRELQVARLVAEGMTNKEIAARLVISLRTAEGHVVRVLAKLGFKSRSQIANWIAEQSKSSAGSP